MNQLHYDFWRTLSFSIFVVLTVVTLSANAASTIIPYGKMTIDGKLDAGLEEKAAKFDLSLVCIVGTIKDDYFSTYLSYDQDYLYFACTAKDNDVSCKDVVSRDFKDSDYIRFYINVEGDYKKRQQLDGKGDWAFIFTPQNSKGKWQPMLKECGYNGPGHGDLDGDKVTKKRKSGPINGGWYVEAAIPFDLFEKKLKDLEKANLGVYFIGGDTDKGGVRSGEVRVPAEGAGGYWQSPSYWQPAELGPFSVTLEDKLATLWSNIKRF